MTVEEAREFACPKCGTTTCSVTIPTRRKTGPRPTAPPFVGCPFIEKWVRVGSHAMGAPHPHDIDYVCLLAKTQRTHARQWFTDNGWRNGAAADYDLEYSFRRMEHNVIIVTDESEFYGFMGAFVMCRKYKVFNKSDRVLIHEGLRRLPFTNVRCTVNKKTREVTPTDACAYGWRWADDDTSVGSASVAPLRGSPVRLP